jgi:hypothetical protein
MSEFWSGDLGLTLMTISLVLLICVVTPLRAAGLPGRLLRDVVMVILMVHGTHRAHEDARTISAWQLE